MQLNPADTSLFQDFQQGSLRQIFTVKWDNNSFLRFWMIINSVASLHSIQHETFSFK